MNIKHPVWILFWGNPCILAMLSTPFPPDPTLAVDNVSRVMEKVKGELRPRIWEDLSPAIGKVIQGEGYSSENDPTYADLYANCKSNSSWEHLTGSLYRHHQVAAVEEVRSYLPPRGKLDLLWLVSC